MRQLVQHLLQIVFGLTILACAGNPQYISITEQKPHPTEDNKKTLLIIGQDLDSIADYANSGLLPEPGGVTTYLAFYRLGLDSFPAFGALGMDPDGKPVGGSVNWGAGPLNAYQLAADYPNSALVIGLNIAEGDARTEWTPGGLADIGIGAYDANIRQLARFFRSINNPVYLRIGYEFDGAWNRGYDKRLSYILAYRRIVDVLPKQGVSNVKFVWQASASPVDDIIDGEREEIRDWYPGDGYVDWMGLSWFLPADETRQGAPSQRELASEVVEFARSRGKPVMIAESAPQGFDLTRLTRANIGPVWDGPAGQGQKTLSANQIWQLWYEPLFDFIDDNRDTIRALAYINADWDSQALWSAPYRQGYWGDTRIQANPELLRLWLGEINRPDVWLHAE